MQSTAKCSGRLTVPRTEKNREGSSSPRVHVQVVKTPKGKVSAHQPMLKGKLFVMSNVITAKVSHTRPNAHSKIPIKNPKL